MLRREDLNNLAAGGHVSFENAGGHILTFGISGGEGNILARPLRYAIPGILESSLLFSADAVIGGRDCITAPGSVDIVLVVVEEACAIGAVRLVALKA